MSRAYSAAGTETLRPSWLAAAVLGPAAAVLGPAAAVLGPAAAVLGPAAAVLGPAAPVGMGPCKRLTKGGNKTGNAPDVNTLGTGGPDSVELDLGMFSFASEARFCLSVE